MWCHVGTSEKYVEVSLLICLISVSEQLICGSKWLGGCLFPHMWVHLTVKKIQVGLKLKVTDERQRRSLSAVPLITTEPF